MSGRGVGSWVHLDFRFDRNRIVISILIRVSGQAKGGGHGAEDPPHSPRGVWCLKTKWQRVGTLKVEHSILVGVPEPKSPRHAAHVAREQKPLRIISKLQKEECKPGKTRLWSKEQNGHDGAKTDAWKEEHWKRKEGTSRMTNMLATTLTWSAGMRCAAHTADEPVSSG